MSRSIFRGVVVAALLGASLPSSAGPTYDLCVMFFTRDYREVAKDMCLQCRYQKVTGQPADPGCTESPPEDGASAGKQPSGTEAKPSDKPAAGK